MDYVLNLTSYFRFEESYRMVPENRRVMVKTQKWCGRSRYNLVNIEGFIQYESVWRNGYDYNKGDVPYKDGKEEPDRLTMNGNF